MVRALPELGTCSALLRRFRTNTAPLEGLAQQKFDLRVDRTQFGRRQPFELRPQDGVDSQQKRFFSALVTLC